MFNFVVDKLRSKSESGKVVTPAEALENKSVWSSQRLKDGIRDYEVLMAFMAVDRAAGDSQLREKSLNTIRGILASECRMTFTSEAELLQFVNDYSLLTE